MHRRLVAGASAALVVTALISLPSSAVAADDPQIDRTGDTITYADPALARARTTTVDGTLRVAYLDRIDEDGRPTTDLDYAVVTDEGESVPVQIAEDLPAAAANGDIRAEVVDAGPEDAQLAEATVDTSAAAGAPAASGGAHRAYVVLVTKTGSLPSASSASARLNDEVLDEWVAESGGAMSSFAVADTATLASSPQTKTELCAMKYSFDLWDQGAAQFPDVDFESTGTSNHLVMLISKAGCGASSRGTLGIGTVGGGLDDGGLSTLLWDPDFVDATGVHELGHNFSLGHANVEGAEYYDLYSVMGFGTPGGLAPALDSLYRDRLGLDAPGEVARPAASTDTTFDLSARGLDSGRRSIAIKDPLTAATYWIDYRTGVGRDVGSTFASGTTYAAAGLRYAPGVVVYKRSADYAASGDIDVVKREAGAIDDTSWHAGQTFTPRSGGFSVRILDTGSTSATVRVIVNGVFSATAPTTTGTLKVGGTVQAKIGTYTPTPTSYRYQWYWRGDRAIKGATSSSFKISAGYRGERLRVRVTGVRAGYPSKNTISPSTGVIAAGTFTATSPSVRGSARVGSTLRAAIGTYAPRPTSYRYQWYSGSTAIKGATKSAYTISSTHRGAKLRVRVTGVRVGYTSKNTISGYTGTVAR